MTENLEMQAALVDVRKAYRLVWAYQRRLFDIVKATTDEFEDMGFYYWQTIHTARPANSGSSPFSRWAWDMLPMRRASFLFLNGSTERNLARKGQWMLELHLNSDTGFPVPPINSEPDAADFTPADQCSSELTICAWLCAEDAPCNWFHGVWSVTEWPENDNEVYMSAKPPFHLFRRTFDLAGLGDRASVHAAIVKFKADASAALNTTLS